MYIRLCLPYCKSAIFVKSSLMYSVLRPRSVLMLFSSKVLSKTVRKALKPSEVMLVMMQKPPR